MIPKNNASSAPRDKTTTEHRSAVLCAEDAIELVRAHFPFPGYMDPHVPACIDIAKTVMRYLPPARTLRVLDFGSGPCDKTAVIAALGYQCSAYDDLQDDWHSFPGHRQAIIDFAAAMRIDFRLATTGQFPWEPHTFDLIMLNDVLEHLHNSPRTLLNSLLELLKDGGYLLITVPSAVNIRKRVDVLFGRTNLPRFESYYWYPDPWRGHIREYTKGDLRLLARNLGVSIVELRACDYMLQVLPSPSRPLYCVVTWIFRGWKDSWLVLAQKPMGWKPRNITRGQLSRILASFGGAYPSDAVAQ